MARLTGGRPGGWASARQAARAGLGMVMGRQGRLLAVGYMHVMIHARTVGRPALLWVQRHAAYHGISWYVDRRDPDGRDVTVMFWSATPSSELLRMVLPSRTLHCPARPLSAAAAPLGPPSPGTYGLVRCVQR